MRNDSADETDGESDWLSGNEHKPIKAGNKDLVDVHSDKSLFPNIHCLKTGFDTEQVQTGQNTQLSVQTADRRTNPGTDPELSKL